MFEVLQHRFLLLGPYIFVQTEIAHQMYMNFEQTFVELRGWILLTLIIFGWILSHYQQVKVFFTYVLKYLQWVNNHRLINDYWLSL